MVNLDRKGKERKRENLVFSGENRRDGAIRLSQQLIHPLPQGSNLILTCE